MFSASWVASHTQVASFFNYKYYRVEHPWLWLCLKPEDGQQPWPAFPLSSSEPEKAAASLMHLRQQEKHRQWGTAWYANGNTTKGEGHEFPTSWEWKSAPLSHTHKFEWDSFFWCKVDCAHTYPTQTHLPVHEYKLISISVNSKMCWGGVYQTSTFIYMTGVGWWSGAAAK